MKPLLAALLLALSSPAIAQVSGPAPSAPDGSAPAAVAPTGPASADEARPAVGSPATAAPARPAIGSPATAAPARPASAVNNLNEEAAQAAREASERKFRDWDRRAHRALTNICSGCGVTLKRTRGEDGTPVR